MRAVRTILLAACGALVAGCSDVPAGDATAARAPASATSSPPAVERPYSVQLHVHGSFSEGVGSIDSHGFEASDVDVDVLWWSDHDFRITSHGHVSSFSFDALREEMDAEQVAPAGVRRRQVLETRLKPLRTPLRDRGSAEIVRDDAREGEGSLRLRARNDAGELAAYGFAIDAQRGLFKRPLASDVTLLLSVLPESTGPDARVVVDVTLSEHPPREGLPFTTYALRYVLDAARTEPYREGTTFVVPVPFRPGEWNDLALPVSRDAVRGFPFIHGEDNSMSAVSIAVEARRGAEAAARFDDFRIEQQLSGAAAFERQKRLIGEVARDYPDVEQLQGIEISWAANHLNEFSVDTAPLDYDRLLAEVRTEPADGAGRGATLRDRLTSRIVAGVHARGGLVSYNHMYGAMMPGAEAKLTREEVLDHLLATRVFGADLLEVGYRERGGRTLEDHLWVWDRLAGAGLFLVGTGVSDSHGGKTQRWRTSPNNFVSWIYARSPGKQELIDGMRAGRVYFGDRVLFAGTVELTTPRGARMGQIVLTDAQAQEVDIRLTGLEAGDVVRVVESGRVATTTTAAGGGLALRHRTTLDPAGPTTVRAEAWTADGRAKVLSNPITFVREAPPEGIPPARAGLDVGGLGIRSNDGFTVASAMVDADGTVRIAGRASGAHLVLDASALGDSPSVELVGLAGDRRAEPGVVALSGLVGEGEIRLRRGG